MKDDWMIVVLDGLNMIQPKQDSGLRARIAMTRATVKPQLLRNAEIKRAWRKCKRVDLALNRSAGCRELIAARAEYNNARRGAK